MENMYLCQKTLTGMGVRKLPVRTYNFATCEGSNLKKSKEVIFSSLLAARPQYCKGIDFLQLLYEKDVRNENNLFFLKDSVQGRMSERFS
jgi:hypothetical protein